jgi:hypothetical protein
MMYLNGVNGVKKVKIIRILNNYNFSMQTVDPDDEYTYVKSAEIATLRDYPVGISLKGIFCEEDDDGRGFVSVNSPIRIGLKYE